METITLQKFSHEEYWTQEYEKFNTLPRDGENTNLFNVGTRDNPDLVMYKFKKNHNNLTDEEDVIAVGSPPARRFSSLGLKLTF